MRALIVCVALGALSAQAFADAFDIVTYAAPRSWQRSNASDSAIQLSRQDSATGAFATVLIVKSAPAGGDSRTNFAASWKSIVTALVATGEPQMQPDEQQDGWVLASGAAPYQDKTGKGVVTLVNASGGGKTMNLIVLTNTTRFQSEISALIESIKLPPVSATAAPSSMPASGPAIPGRPTKLVGRWQKTEAASNPNNIMASGYVRSRYELHADGSYLFTQRSYWAVVPEIGIVKETGRYTVSGDTLSITPAESAFFSYKKANGVDELGPLATTKNRPLEAVAYRFRFHYFSGMQMWYLVLQADRETLRDGKFSGNNTFPNAYYFDQQYIDTELTAVKN